VLHRYNKKPIEIARLQRFAMDSFHAAGGKLLRRSQEEHPEKIACIGAGSGVAGLRGGVAATGFFR